MVHKNVEKIREAKGVTKTHIAKALNMSVMGYSHIENGATRLDVGRLQKIAAILETDVAVFFDDQLTDSVINRQKRATG
ncbi:helix-turn-helix domain-containing protein [Indiicoccus explosivorum]|uniref:helix-turn-helix domain-containing protein n=1 Tax=Indiicoccus explosivorum TaxID=1917864 RepID=UPI000B441379|nr:helix-turn-helix transcriptional regulator [Indiicoccus explosivorum]